MKLETRPAPSSRWTLLRDVAAFQVKLLADALRDLLLSPVSLVCGFMDLLRPGGGRFQALMRFGRRTDRWINLFGAGAQAEPAGKEDWSIDETIARVEERLRADYEGGGVTRQVVTRIDRALDQLNQEDRGR
jgi:hypothetical protein